MIDFIQPDKPIAVKEWIPNILGREPRFPYKNLPEVIKNRFLELSTPGQAWRLGQCSKDLQAHKVRIRVENPKVVDYLILNAKTTNNFKEEYGWKQFNGVTITSNGYAVLALDNFTDHFAQLDGIYVIRGIALKNYEQSQAEDILSRIRCNRIERFQIDCDKNAWYNYEFFKRAKQRFGYRIFIGSIEFQNPVLPSPLFALKEFVSDLEGFKFCVKTSLSEEDERQLDEFLENNVHLPKTHVGYIHVHLPDAKNMYFYKNYSTWNGFTDNFAEKAAIIFGYTRSSSPTFFKY